MKYRVHIEMSRDGYPLRLNTALLVGGSSQGVAKARALELAREQHPECDDFRVYQVEELGKCKKTLYRAGRGPRCFVIRSALTQMQPLQW